jgi:hypothetical protein
MGAVWHAVEAPDYNRTLASVRGALGEEAFAAAWAERRAMLLDAVVAYALEGGGNA